MPLQYPTGTACENNLLSVGQIEVFEMVKLQALRVVIGCLSISLVVMAAGLLPTLSATEDEPPNNMSCVTSLMPAVCSNAGNSICDGLNPCNRIATFCDSTGNTEETFCITSEGANCDVVEGGPSTDCTPGDRTSCTCTATGVPQQCRCPDPMVTGPCGTLTPAPSCS